MEASTLHAPLGLRRSRPAIGQARPAIGAPLLRLRSDEQLVALLRDGHEEAFRVIHDRYRKRLLAYAQQMLPLRHDAEDVLQDVFARAYWALRAGDRQLALRAWLFRVAHNRCVDELRRPCPPPPEAMQPVRGAIQDPIAESDRRESLRRLIADIRRLPAQQRSALLMRELSGMSYAELACSLGISVGAVKSLLVRARMALAQAAAARDAACSEIREELVLARDRGVRPNAMARRHIRDCAACCRFRRDLRGVDRRLAALLPVGPLGLFAKLLGCSGSAGSGATAGGAGGYGSVAAGGVTSVAAGGATAGGTTAVSAGAVAAGAPHVATLIIAAVATAGSAAAIQHSVSAHRRPHARHARAFSSRQTQIPAGGRAPSHLVAAGSLSGQAALSTVANASSTTAWTVRRRHPREGLRLTKAGRGSGLAGDAGGQAIVGLASISGLAAATAACGAATQTDSAPGGYIAGGSTPGGSTAGGITTGGPMGRGYAVGGFPMVATIAPSPAGGSTTGGSTTGGSTTGGSTTAATTTAGSTTGGSTTGALATGGSTTGGSATGGSATGGSAAGGSTTGGSATGGSTTEGSATVAAAICALASGSGSTIGEGSGSPAGAAQAPAGALPDAASGSAPGAASGGGDGASTATGSGSAGTSSTPGSGSAGSGSTSSPLSSSP